MNLWDKIVAEMVAAGKPDRLNFDLVRRAKLAAVESQTRRPLIVYASDFLNPAKVQMSGGDVSLDYSDKLGFMEVVREMDGKNLDLLVHSPGGVPEAVESVVAILRDRFENVRVIVPDLAKSAATMLALSGDVVALDEAGELGPIDPQFNFRRQDGTVVTAPAQAIIDQFKYAAQQITENPKMLTPWLPILQQYGPSLLFRRRMPSRCRNCTCRIGSRNTCFEATPRLARRPPAQQNT